MRGLSAAFTFAIFASLAASASAAPPKVRPSKAPRPSRTSRDNVIRLAEALDDERTVASLKRERAVGPRGTEDDVKEAVRAYEGLGDPDGAVNILKRRLARVPDEEGSHILLAQLYERMGKTDLAIPEWQLIDRKFGLSVEHTVGYARALSRLGRLDDALALLKSHPPSSAKPAPPPPPPPPSNMNPPPPVDYNLAYYRDLAVLAWELDDSPVALDAYRRVWAGDRTTPDAALRLMTLLSEAGFKDEANKVATEAYNLEKNPQYVLFIAEQYEKVDDWAGVARILDIPISEQVRFEGREQFWLLRAEAYDHLGNKNAARDAYRAALHLNPSSVPVRLALLWDALDRNDVVTLRDYVHAWQDDVEDEPEMWGPYAMALVKVGRVREAIPYFQMRVRQTPDEYVTMIAYADALDELHLGDIALRLRRHALGKLRSSLIAKRTDPKAQPPDFELLRHHTELTREMQGAEQGQRWFAFAMEHSKPSDEREDFVLGWHIDNDQAERSRKRLAASTAAADPRPIWDSYRLTLASEEDDRYEMARLLATSHTLGYAERYQAQLELERDDQALATIQEQLAKDDTVADEPELRLAQREILERHAPLARAGGTYEYVDGLDLEGPDALVAHDWGRARVIYEGWGREMTSPNQSVIVPDGRKIEADLGVTLRFQQRDDIFEIGAGANWQSKYVVPHAELYTAQDILRDRVSTVVSAHLNMPIEETPFMRLVGVRDELQMVGHVDIGSRLYTEAEGVLRDDTSRTYEQLGAEVGGSADLGLHILRRDPELNTAFRATGFHRWNVSKIPDDLLEVIPFGTKRDVDTYLAPSYGMLSVVVQLTKGDFFERQRAERLPLPRYDCTAEFGYLFPQHSPAGEFRCSASVRVGRHGYVSALGSYNLGFFGIEDASSAKASLSYTQLFL